MRRLFPGSAMEWDAALIVAAFVAVAILVASLIDEWQRRRKRGRRR